MERIVKTVYVAGVYCVIWCFLETLLYGSTQSQIEDSIIFLLFIPIIYKAMDHNTKGGAT